MGLRAWQDAFDEFQVTLPFYKTQLDTWTPESIQVLWKSQVSGSPLVIGFTTDATASDDEEEPDHFGYNAGWCPGASVTSAKAIRVGVVLNKKNFFFFAGNLA